jgi:hypothetical protein
MPTSAAQIASNKANSLKSSGPKTAEGLARSSRNALKHGLTGAGIALPIEDAAEVDRLQRDLESEMKPSGELGRTLVRRMALLAVRMDRCVAHETASLTVGIEEAEAEFDAAWPAVEGEDNPDREQARIDVGRLALFDASPEACLARKYEAAAERGFFRTLKEFRQVEKQAKASGIGPEASSSRSPLGSFFPETMLPPAPAPKRAQPAPTVPPVAAKPIAPAPKPLPKLPVDLEMSSRSHFDVPFAIGRAC